MLKVKVLKFIQRETPIRDKKRNYEIIVNTIKPEEKYDWIIKRIFIPPSEASPPEENFRFHESLEKYKSGMDLLLVDLSEYQTRIPLYDFIAATLCKLCESGFTIVFLVSDLSLPQDSRGLQSIHGRLNTLNLTLTFVSLSGQVLYIGKSSSVKSIVLSKAVTKPSQFRKRLLSFGNIWYYGHYVLSSGTHIRAFIDLYPAVLDTDSYDYIENEARRIKGISDFDLIVGFGLCSSAIEELGGALKASLENVGYIFYDPKYEDIISDSIRKGKKRILLLSDVMYSGRTAAKIANSLKSEGAEIEGFFVILAAQGAPEDILLQNGSKARVNSCTKMKLSFAKNKASCSLCKIDYPSIKSRNVEKYLSAPDLPIAPYDFWSIVKDADALEISHKVLHEGRSHYYHYVNTLKCFEQFGDWIAFILCREIKRKCILGNIPIRHLVYPQERAAELISSILMKKLHRYIPSSSDCLIPVSREDIERAMPTQASDAAKRKYNLISQKNILIVDDGINTLRTHKGLMNIAGNLGANVLGIICFLNRLSHAKMNTWGKNLEIPFIYVYHYPMPPWPATECPFCRGVSFSP